MTTSTSRHSSALAAATADDRIPSGHEGPFVQPSSYLRQRGLSHPMAPAATALSERAIDREERQGLVSLSFPLWLLLFVAVAVVVPAFCPAPPRA